MDKDIRKMIKCAGIASSVTLFIIWLYIASMEGFAKATIKILISFGVSVLILLWVAFCVYVFYKEED